jgi:hypothetical protein
MQQREPSPAVEHESPSAGQVRSAHECLRCKMCAEVIGVYEPLIALLHGQPHETSRAAREGVGAFGESAFTGPATRLEARHERRRAPR